MLMAMQVIENQEPRKQKTEAERRYRKTQVKRITVDFYPSESSLWEHLGNQPQKQTYIKNLIRADLEAKSNIRICPTCKTTWHNRETICPTCGTNMLNPQNSGEEEAPDSEA